MIDKYVHIITLVQRVHRAYHQHIRRELERIGATDIDAQRAVILLNIGRTKIAIHQVRTRGNYLGSNLSNIIEGLVATGYLERERSSRDLRVTHVSLSAKGNALYHQLRNVHEHHANGVLGSGNGPDLEHAIWTLRQLEQLCIDQELNG
jgi:DNA-binding MarR family transcriptional regulator